MKWGYVRVSTKGQHLRRQLDAMREEGVDDTHVIIDKASGKNFDRAGYKKLLRQLKPKDVLCIQSLDRLGRNYEEIPVEWNKLVREKKVSIRILDMNLLNSREGMTREEYFMANMMLMFTSFSADQERRKIRERQKQGIISAKNRRVAAFTFFRLVTGRSPISKFSLKGSAVSRQLYAGPFQSEKTENLPFKPTLATFLSAKNYYKFLI